MPLPNFRYHPDPLSTGVVKASDAVCHCCGLARGFEYIASTYTSQKDRPTLCPWCIASGDAARKFDAFFSDDQPLRAAGLSEEIIREVCERTPGYVSWQQEVWQSHCNDACEFHGDVEPDELRDLSKEQLADFLQEFLEEDEWPSFVKNYQKSGDPAVYKFVCRQCGQTIYSWDCS